MRKKFWKDWQKITKLEETAIESIKKAKKILLQLVPKDRIMAIYVKGSFVRREMVKKSDVDIVLIVKDLKTKKEIQRLDKERGTFYRPSELLPKTVQELKSPNPFIDRLNSYKLIYGKSLKTSEFPFRNKKERLKGLIKAFNNEFLPNYEKGTFGFSELVKQVFWLTDLEEQINGKKVAVSWKELTNSIRFKNHIIHDALKFRLHPTKDKIKRRIFIVKLRKHLELFV